MAVTHPDDREAVAAHLRRRAPPTKPTCTKWCSACSRRPATPTWSSIAASAVYGDDGLYLGRRGSNRDITERRRAEEEIRRLNDGASRARRQPHRAARGRHPRARGARVRDGARRARPAAHASTASAPCVMEDEARPPRARGGRQPAARARRPRRRWRACWTSSWGSPRWRAASCCAQPLDLSALALEVGAEEAAEHPGKRRDPAGPAAAPRRGRSASRAHHPARVAAATPGSSRRRTERRTWRSAPPTTDGEPPSSSATTASASTCTTRSTSSACSSACTRRTSSRATASDSRPCNVWSAATTGAAGPTAEPEKGATIFFTLPPAQAAG